MAVRRFNGAGDFITCAIGNLVGFNAGAFTIAALVKKEADGGFFPIVSAETGNSGRRGLWSHSTDVLAGLFSGTLTTGPVTYMQADDWAVTAITKPAGPPPDGITAVRFHKGVLGGSWTHADGNDGSNDGQVLDNIKIGTFQDAAHWAGLIAVIGLWSRELSDSELEDGFRTSLGAWLAATPDGLWALNQTSTATAVEDLTGGGADQTAIDGTSVELADDPPGFSLASGIEVQLDAATEVDEARPVAVRKVATLAAAREADAALAASSGQAGHLDRAVTADAARPVTVVRVAHLSPAREAATANALAGSKTARLGLATERDAALAVTGPTALVIPGRLTAYTTRPRLTATTRVGIPAAPPLLNALTNPSMFGWPDASNTGVPVSANLTDSGPLVITTPGAVVEDLLVDGTGTGTAIEVRVSNVTIRRVHVIGRPTPGGGCIKQTNGATGMRIEWSELEFDQPGSGDAVVGDGNWTMERCHIHHVAEGPRLGSNCTIRYCYIHSLVIDNEDAHADGLQSTGGSNIVVHRNTIRPNAAGAFPANAAAIIGSEFALSTNITFTENLLDYGGWTFYLGPSEDFGMSNVLVRGNRFGPHAVNGPVSIEPGTVNLTWTDNRMDATNQLVLAA